MGNSGCGRLNASGHHFKTYPLGDTTTTNYTPSPEEIGAADFVYGGVIASVIDCHSTGSAAIFWMHAAGQEVGDDLAPRFVTARLEVDYLAPTPLGPLHLTGRILEIGERKVVVATDLEAGDSITARGYAVLVRVPDK